MRDRLLVEHMGVRGAVEPPDPGQAGDLRRNGDPRIHVCIELPDDLPFSEDLGSDLCHAVIHRVESGSLDIK